MSFKKPHRESFHAAAGTAAGMAMGSAGAFMALPMAVAPLFVTVCALTGAAAGYSEALHKNRMALYDSPSPEK